MYACKGFIIIWYYLLVWLNYVYISRDIISGEKRVDICHSPALLELVIVVRDEIVVMINLFVTTTINKIVSYDGELKCVFVIYKRERIINIK
jgi:hypothetical protein